jgi:hypothetical protein
MSQDVLLGLMNEKVNFRCGVFTKDFLRQLAGKTGIVTKNI